MTQYTIATLQHEAHLLYAAAAALKHRAREEA
jgi:hypothetical protein